MNTTPRYRRGDPSPVDAGMVFFRYRGSVEQWVRTETLNARRDKCSQDFRKWGSREGARELIRQYDRKRNKTAKRKAYESARSKSPEYREKYKHIFRKAVAKYSRTPKGKAKAKEMFQKHKAKINDWRRKNLKLRRATDPQFKIGRACRATMRIALKKQGLKKSDRTVALLGCDVAFFCGWLEAQFIEGMTWQNHGSAPGQWEIDHILPIVLFDLTNRAQRLQAFGYRNCAPMWSHENRDKSDKLPDGTRARDLRNIIQFRAA